MTIACPDCGTVQDLPMLSFRGSALCPVCDRRLQRTSGRSVDAALACSLATVILLLPANLAPLMTVSMLGMTRESRAGSGVVSLWQASWVILAACVALFVVLLPLIRFGLLTTVLGCVRVNRRPRWLGRTFRWAMVLDFWAMPDVFLLGCAVGYSRVAANLPVNIGWGAICMILSAFLAMLSRALLDRRAVWHVIAPQVRAPDLSAEMVSCSGCDLVFPAEEQGRSCPRCDAPVRARKPHSQLRTTALLIAAFALYLPANLYPMSTAMQLGESVPHRIIDGILELYQAGLWPLGVLIFCTSVAIPLLKILGLGWLALSIHLRSQRHLVLKTKLYRVIDEIGRWSAIDVFTISVFVPVLQFGSLASAQAATGATAFILVVVLTMIASQVFDPRLMWDALEANRA